MDSRIQNLQDRKKKQEIRKQLRIPYPHEETSYLNFSNCDVLHLLSHPLSRKLSYEYALKWGIGSLPSRPLGDFEKKREESELFLKHSLEKECTAVVPSTTPFLNNCIKALLSTRSLLIKPNSYPYSPNTPIQTKTFSQESASSLKDVLERLPKEKFDHIVLFFESISSK